MGVTPAGYVSLFLNHSGIWRKILPCTSLSEKGSGHKNGGKTTRNAKFTSKSRQTAKNGGCAAKSTLHFLKNKGFGGSPYVYLKVLPVPYLQMRGVVVHRFDDSITRAPIPR